MLLERFTKDRNNRLPIDAMKRLEMKDFTWDRLFDLKPHELGELLRVPKLGKPVRVLWGLCFATFVMSRYACMCRILMTHRGWEGSSTRLSSLTCSHPMFASPLVPPCALG
jgi:hypothetical protein